MPQNIEISKFFKFKSINDDNLTAVFNTDRFNNSSGCNVYKSKTDDNLPIYVWIRTFDLSIFDLIEESLQAEEISIEEMKTIEDDPDYKLISDIPFKF